MPVRKSGVRRKKILQKPKSGRFASVLLGSWYGLVIVLFSSLVIGILLVTLFSWNSLKLVVDLQRSSHLSWPEVVGLAKVAVTTQPAWHNTTMLVLGTDELATRGDQRPLTDTIVLVGFNPFKSTITLLPIPRDVWIEAKNTKINALYADAREHSPTTALQTTQASFESILSLPIDHTLVVSMTVVKELIDAVGGVTIDVPVAFTDSAFPRMDVDVTTETDPSKLYETISFSSGQTHLDGTTALKYMRSRHSLGSEGNDMARSRRQQQVMVALIEKIKQALSDRSFTTLIQLLTVYKTHLDSQLSLAQATALLVSLPGNPAQYTFHSSALPLQPATSSGVLYHPNQHNSGQWVFVMTSLADFQSAIRAQLGLTQDTQP